MHDSDLPTTDDPGSDPVAPPAAEVEVDPVDAELDDIAADLDTVEAAMKALDADEMDDAEALAGSLSAGPPAIGVDDEATPGLGSDEG